MGNEGAGTVVAAGSSPAAQALLGKTVGIAGGGMYAQYRAVDAAGCLVLPEGATAEDGASSLANPLTALGMLETMNSREYSRYGSTLHEQVYRDASAGCVQRLRQASDREKFLVTPQALP